MATETFAVTKPGLKTAFAEAVFNEIISNSNGYYHFVGKTLSWDDQDDIAAQPVNTLEYEASVRERIIYMKKITAADVAFVIPRYDWRVNEVYDQYDNFIGGTLPVHGFASDGSFTITGDFTATVPHVGIGWLVEGDGIPENTRLIDITSTTITLDKQTTAAINLSQTIKIVNVAASGARSLEESKFYVVTNERNVYKCLSNNRGRPSTVKPYSTTNETIYTADGYIWKFMYTIPNALANKFTTIDEIPVSTSIKSGYYTRGTINSVTIQAYGQNYSPNDPIEVVGDGFQRDNVFQINEVAIVDPGAGYLTNPSVTITEPFDAVEFQPNTSYATGQYIRASDRFYRVEQSGQTGTTAPIHTAGSVENGTITLTYVGNSVVAESFLSDDTLGGVNLFGLINHIIPTNVGVGYDTNNPPSVTVNDSNGTGATATAVVGADGKIASIRVTSRGSGYTPNATVSIDPPPIVDSVWVAESLVDEADIIRHNNNLYLVVSEGVGQALGLTPPIHVAGEVLNGDVLLQYYGSVATATADVFFGYGFSSTPIITVAPPVVHDIEWSSGGTATLGQIVKVGVLFYTVTEGGTFDNQQPIHTSGTELNGTVELEFTGKQAIAALDVSRTAAIITPVIENGQIVNVIIVDGGVGYTTPDIVIRSSSGTGAVLVPNTDIGDLNTRQAASELLALPGTIDTIDILNEGTEYTAESAIVTVEGDGTGCVANAIVERGRIVRIDVTTPGVNYTRATVTIGTSAGRQAYARAVISPYYGHGKNAIAELFATDIALASTISLDRNKGFIVDNDYRQMGIIKNPNVFNTNNRYNRFNGSACFTITANFSYQDLAEDDVIEDLAGFRYIVVARPLDEPQPGQAFSILVQSIDNNIPATGTTFRYANGLLTATSTLITPPEVDKYSGTMMYIDNRSAFQPTADQAIAIKTVIRL